MIELNYNSLFHASTLFHRLLLVQLAFVASLYSALPQSQSYIIAFE